MPEIYEEEYAALCAYQEKLAVLDEANKQLKALRRELDDKVEKSTAICPWTNQASALRRKVDDSSI